MGTFLRLLTQRETGLNKRATEILEAMRRKIEDMEAIIADNSLMSSSVYPSAGLYPSASLYPSINN